MLKICAGFSSPAARSEVSRNIIGSSKVQKCALEALAAFVNNPGRYVCVRFHFTSSETTDLLRINCRFASVLCVLGVKLKVSDVFSVLIAYLDNPDSEPTVSNVIFRAIAISCNVISK